MSNAPDPSEQSTQSLDSALSFFLLMISILMLCIKFLYTVLFGHGTSQMRFLHCFSASAIEDLTANWIVFVTLIVHVVRTKIGIAYLRYDTTYLNAGVELGTGPQQVRFRNRFVVLNAGISLLIAYLFLSTYPPIVLNVLLIFQGCYSIYFDWYNRKELFHDQADKKANLLIVVGNIGFLLFAVGAAVFHFLAPDPQNVPASGAPAIIVAYYCLFAFAILEMIGLILISELVFTYREAIRLAWGDFKRVLAAG